MNSDTHTKPSSTIQSFSLRPHRGASKGNSPPGTTPHLAHLSTPNERDLPGMTQSAWSCILALDPGAELFKGGNHLKIIHSKCRGQSMQKATNDISNFREHVSICQGRHTSNDNGSLKGSLLQGGPTPSIHPATPTPARPSQLPCPGFSLKKLFGKDYGSLLDHEREQVTNKAKVAGLILLNLEGEGSVFSMSCLEKSPSRESAQPCDNCSKVLRLSNFKDTLNHRTPKPCGKRFSPWLPLNANTISAGEDQEATDVSIVVHCITLSLTTPLGGSLVAIHQVIELEVAVILVSCRLRTSEKCDE